jgi:hypothetical protein
MSNTDDSATSLADARRMVAEGRHVHIGAKISMEGLIWICLDRDDVARLTAAAEGDDRRAVFDEIARNEAAERIGVAGLGEATFRYTDEIGFDLRG